MRNFLFASLTLALASAPIGADTPELGFDLAALPYPGHLATTTLPDGDLIAFDGLSIDRYDASGGHMEQLASFAGFVFPSFLEVAPGGAMLYIGESTNGDIFELPVAGGPLSLVTNLVFNYSAAFEDADHMLVSAATCGFNCGSEIYRVDLDTGVATQIVQLSGPSGPLAVNSGGDLLYGTASPVFPTPPGSIEILRWSAAQTAGGALLTEFDATVVAGGFDGSADLAYDGVHDVLYMLENEYTSGINRVRVIGTSAATSPVLVEGSTGLTMSTLEFEPSTGGATFEGYQPASGGKLRYTSTDFFSIFERHELTPARPRASLAGPGVQGPGPFQLMVTGAPPGGSFFVVYGPRTTYVPTETALTIGGWSPLFTGLDLVSLKILPVPGFLDGFGSGQRTFQNNGNLQGTLVLQAVVFDVFALARGTTNAVFL